MNLKINENHVLSLNLQNIQIFHRQDNIFLYYNYTKARTSEIAKYFPQ
jgi:hypothetical protein